jgi:hypothetical protein
MLLGIFWKGKGEAEREGREWGYCKSLRGMKKTTVAFHVFERQLSGRGAFDAFMLWEISGSG